MILTCSTFESGGGGTKHRRLRRWNIVSFVLDIVIVISFLGNNSAPEKIHLPEKLNMFQVLISWNRPRT